MNIDKNETKGLLILFGVAVDAAKKSCLKHEKKKKYVCKVQTYIPYMFEQLESELNIRIQMKSMLYNRIDLIFLFENIYSTKCYIFRFTVKATTAKSMFQKEKNRRKKKETIAPLIDENARITNVNKCAFFIIFITLIYAKIHSSEIFFCIRISTALPSQKQQQ